MPTPIHLERRARIERDRIRRWLQNRARLFYRASQHPESAQWPELRAEWRAIAIALGFVVDELKFDNIEEHSVSLMIDPNHVTSEITNELVCFLEKIVGEGHVKRELHPDEKSDE